MSISVADIAQIKSKQRVSAHGEVLTAKREVNAMLDLVKQETERIDSRFLEPACGDGNFLVEILSRKLHIVGTRYNNNQIEYERYAVTAVASIYGIDLLEDNVAACRNRVFDIFNTRYTELFKDNSKEECREAIKYILKLNIIWGDALTLNTVGVNPKPIIFAEWSSVTGSMIKRRDFTLSHLLGCAPIKEPNIFSDLGDDVFIPTPIREYPLMHFLSIADAK